MGVVITDHQAAPAPQPVPQTAGQKSQETQTAPQADAPRTETAPVDPVKARELEFARREKTLRRQFEQFKREKSNFEQTMQQKLQESEKTYHEQLKSNFWDQCIKAGLTPDEIIQNLTNKPSAENTQLTQLQHQLAQMRSDQEKIANQAQENEKRAYDQAKGLIAKDVALLINEGDSFEAIKAMGAEDAVVELIETTLNEEGRMMSIEDAAKEVEDYLLDEIYKSTQLKKIQARLKPQEPKPVAPTQNKPGVKQPAPTLSNRLPSAPPAQKLSSQQRRERAIKVAMGLPVD